MTVRSLLAAALLCAGFRAPALHAQKVPERPRMPATADTNDASAYYTYGLMTLDNDPEKAAQAFYWATRLNPQAAVAFYSERTAMLLEDRYRLVRYWQGNRGTLESDDIKRIDSLYYHALTLDPFVPTRLDGKIFDAVLAEISEDLERRTGASSTEIDFQLRQYMFDAPADLRAWQAAAEGRLGSAIRLYAEAIDKADFKAPLRIDRATAFYATGQMDSCLAELNAAAAEMRKRDNKDLVYVYNSKALLDERIAVVDLRMGRLDSARAALGQALQEDLSYSPAHVYLALLAMQTHDTATALNEMQLATQLRSDDPAPLYSYGEMLVHAGRYADAEAPLHEAIRLDSVYAAPHFELAMALDHQGKTAQAEAEYRTFLMMASRGDAHRATADARAKALQAAAPPAPDSRQ